MFDNRSHYTLHTEEVDGTTYYFVSFTNGLGELCKTEVTHEVYLEFERFVKTERNLRRWDERHLEYSALTDAELLERALHTPESVEEIVMNKLESEHLRKAIAQLPKVQRKRIALHYFHGLTFRKIGELEGRHWTTIAESVTKAEEKLKVFGR